MPYMSDTGRHAMTRVRGRPPRERLGLAAPQRAAAGGGPDRAGREPARGRRGLLGADRRSDGRDGRGSRDGARRAGMVPGQLGGDDGRDDAAGHGADGRRRTRACARRRGARATLAFVAGYLLAWGAAGLAAYALIEGVRSRAPRLPGLGRGRTLRRGRRHPRRRAVSAHARQGGVPAPLPRPRWRPAAGSSTARTASRAAGR